MKKLLFLLALVFSFAIGCQTDISTDIAPSKEDGEIALSVSLASTRVYLGDKVGNSYPAYWSEGDRLTVNAQQSDEAIIDNDNRSKATFKFSEAATLSYPLNITYPHCAATTSEQPLVEFPAVQSYVEGSFEKGCAPMCGYVANSGNNVTLNHLATILHFPIKATAEGVALDKVVATSNSKIAGIFGVDCQNSTISATENCESVITYLLPANFTLSTTTTSDLFIVLPAVEISTCVIEFMDSSGEKMTATWSPNKHLSRGVVHDFNTITYQQRGSISLPPMSSEEGELTFPYNKYADNDEIKIMSFNVRTKTSESDPANNWDNRKEACVLLVKDQRPSVIGYQEAQYTLQWAYLKEQLADKYESYGVNRDDGTESGKGEVMGIMYDRATVEKLDGGTFWLSETPDVPSKGFGASYSRNATWGLFKHIPSGKIFYYINTHLDHQVSNAKVEGMKLISQHFEEYKDRYPVFLTGDLNAAASNVAIDPIESYMVNARSAAPATHTDFVNTYNAYKVGGGGIIDHIYCSDYLKVVEYHTVIEKYGTANYVSDHYPIYAIIELK